MQVNPTQFTANTESADKLKNDIPRKVKMAALNQVVDRLQNI